MNRRSFLSSILKGAAAFTILPSAGRVWKVTRESFPVRVTERYFTFEELHDLRTELLNSLGPYVPTFQDFLAASQRSSKYEIEAMAKLLAEPKVWPPNMGETKRIIKHAHLRRIDNQRNVRGIILPDTHRSSVFPAHG
jgi:hypothetical protein